MVLPCNEFTVSSVQLTTLATVIWSQSPNYKDKFYTRYNNRKDGTVVRSNLMSKNLSLKTDACSALNDSCRKPN